MSTYEYHIHMYVNTSQRLHYLGVSIGFHTKIQGVLPNGWIHDWRCRVVSSSSSPTPHGLLMCSPFVWDFNDWCESIRRVWWVYADFPSQFPPIFWFFALGLKHLNMTTSGHGMEWHGWRSKPGSHIFDYTSKRCQHSSDPILCPIRPPTPVPFADSLPFFMAEYG